MIASKEDEDDAYRLFAKACGDAWSMEGTKIAEAAEDQKAIAAAADMKSVQRMPAENASKTR